MPPVFEAPATVLVRPVPDRFSDCLREHPADIDVAQARQQHTAYVAAIEAAGVAVHRLPALHDHPDSCFVEDPVVVLGDRAVLTRSATRSRRSEGTFLKASLSDWCSLSTMPAPATLDGGDVLRIGETLYVGRTNRSNPAGITWLQQVAAAAGLAVVPVPLRAGLHLKSAVTLASPDLLVYCPAMLHPGPLADAGLELLPTDEPFGGNVLALGETVLVSAAAPGTAEALVRRGLRVSVVAVDEFHKGDGALTCLSIRLPRPGTWAA